MGCGCGKRVERARAQAAARQAAREALDKQKKTSQLAAPQVKS